MEIYFLIYKINKNKNVIYINLMEIVFFSIWLHNTDMIIFIIKVLK